MARLLLGDCLIRLKAIKSDSIDSIVTDPPYELGFMGKTWDKSGIAYNVEVWRECSRVLKPGGHLLAFGGSRTYHRLASAIEDAGFEIRDQIMWIYGSGFPKSLDVSKAIDKAAGAERTEVVGSKLGRPGMSKDGSNQRSNFDTAFGEGEGTPMDHNLYAPATEEAKQWQGWGTALKPAHEPIVLARKPFKGTVARNVQEHGTGGINVDGCRVQTAGADKEKHLAEWNRVQSKSAEESRVAMSGGLMAIDLNGFAKDGRWPANVIHDGSDEVTKLFPETKQGIAVNRNKSTDKHSGNTIYGARNQVTNDSGYADDTNSAARFFYCAKTNKKDRSEGNNHPTVKPTDLMRYLCRLITPPNGTILDPFMGSGSTGKAAALEGFRFVGIEKEAAYYAIAKKRILAALDSVQK